LLFNQVEEKNIMQAIILAAGMGKRLGELTKDNTKCMVEVGGVKLIERALQILDKKNLSQIILVVGYQYENLMTL
jgi:choline kinase